MREGKGKRRKKGAKSETRKRLTNILNRWICNCDCDIWRLQPRRQAALHSIPHKLHHTSQHDQHGHGVATRYNNEGRGRRERGEREARGGREGGEREARGRVEAGETIKGGKVVTLHKQVEHTSITLVHQSGRSAMVSRTLSSS